jgi:hypothetical protein
VDQQRLRVLQSAAKQSAAKPNVALRNRFGLRR